MLSRALSTAVLAALLATSAAAETHTGIPVKTWTYELVMRPGAADASIRLKPATREIEALLRTWSYSGTEIVDAFEGTPEFLGKARRIIVEGELDAHNAEFVVRKATDPDQPAWNGAHELWMHTFFDKLQENALTNLMQNRPDGTVTAALMKRQGLLFAALKDARDRKAKGESMETISAEFLKWAAKLTHVESAKLVRKLRDCAQFPAALAAVLAL
jgi:hypothetical protein